MSSYFSSWLPRKDASKSRNTPDAPDAPAVEPNWTPDHLLAFAFGTASGAGALLVWRRWGMRLPTAEWVTPNVLARHRWVRGVVTSVGDGDDFRLYHTPGIGWRWPLEMRRVPTRRRDLKDQTIHVRIAGVDAPEGAHYGRPGQPHAQESLAWLRQRIQGKTLYCQLIRKDQYGRIVGVPLVPRPFLPLFLGKYAGSPLALEMLRAGTVMMYGESGAEYGPWGWDEFVRIEAEARAARRGMWKNGVDIETPGEYKKRYAAALGSAGKEEDSDDGKESKGLLSRLRALVM